MKRVLLVAFLCAVPLDAAGQPLCTEAETAFACVNRLAADPNRPVAPAADAQTAVKKKTETGLDPTTGLSSSVKDFLPLLRLAGVLGNLTTDEETGVITVALNTPFLGLAGRTKDPALQLKALIETKPKLFDPLRQALPADTRDAVEKQLLEVTNRQNVSLEFSYNFTGRSLGRAFEQYRPLLDNLFQATYASIQGTEAVANQLLVDVIEIVARPRTARALVAFSGAARTIVRTGSPWRELGDDVREVRISGTASNNGTYGVEKVSGNTITLVPGSKITDETGEAVFEVANDAHVPNGTPWKDLPAVKRARIENAIVAGRAAGALKLETLFNDTVRNSGLDVFGQLINNQPQLHVTVSRAFRDTLYGPETLTGRITYERGLANNVNELKSRARGRCDDDGRSEAAACLAALAAFAGDPATKAAIKAGTRLAFFAEFIKIGNYDRTLEGHGVAVAFEEGTGWNAGLDFGRLFGVSEDGTASARVDGSVRYERPARPLLGNKRYVASLTLTKKFGDVSVPFGLVYANKPEFLKDVDHHLGAHVGLKFNLFPDVK
ncbi:MAG: hypothetical protein H0W53_20705 [Acidobacteria bacterium]|nr:hypothetical protein [Acidobacteriota bacterium]